MSGDYCVDANIFITSWYKDYPPRILSPLWELIAKHKDDIIIIKPVFNQIEPISSADRKLSIPLKREKYPLRIWLEDNGFTAETVSDEINSISLLLEKEYETSNASKGADQIDILLIAYAKYNGKTVVTFEAEQPQLPGKRYNYKIPLICREQGVNCINFIEMLDLLKINI